jgi:hypothetical protein
MALFYQNSPEGYFEILQICGALAYFESVFRIHDILGWIRIRILDPDPAIFVIDLQDASKKLIFNTISSAYHFLKVHLHHFSKKKSQKESQYIRNQVFLTIFA